jgi:hypothetical protein
MCHAAGTWEAHLHGAHLSVVARVGALRRVRRPLGNLTIGRLRRRGANFSEQVAPTIIYSNEPVPFYAATA